MRCAPQYVRHSNYDPLCWPLADRNRLTCFQRVQLRSLMDLFVLSFDCTSHEPHWYFTSPSCHRLKWHQQLTEHTAAWVTQTSLILPCPTGWSLLCSCSRGILLFWGGSRPPLSLRCLQCTPNSRFCWKLRSCLLQSRPIAPLFWWLWACLLLKNLTPYF